MNNEFRICNKCKAMNVSSIVPKLEEIDPNAKIIIGCQNFCGIGRTKNFAIVNHIPIIADTEEELILKIKEFLKKN